MNCSLLPDYNEIATVAVLDYWRLAKAWFCSSGRAGWLRHTAHLPKSALLPRNDMKDSHPVLRTSSVRTTLSHRKRVLIFRNDVNFLVSHSILVTYPQKPGEASPSPPPEALLVKFFHAFCSFSFF